MVLMTRIGLFDQLSQDSSPKLELARIAAGAHAKPVVNGYTKKEGKPDLVGLPSKRSGFLKQLLPCDQNLLGRDRSLS
jgi:hypothetical protein